MTAAIYQLNGVDAFTRRQGTEKAWHGLGGETPADAPLEIWAQNAGMDFTIESAPVDYSIGEKVYTVPKRRVLYRSDTRAHVGIVSDIYKVVQPSEVLEFFRSLTQAGGFQMDTAGVLKNGAKYWALASNGMEGALGADIIKPYLLVATASDGSLATTTALTTIRVVCENTLQMSLRNNGSVVKVRHSTEFDADSVKAQLGVDDNFGHFMSDAENMASRGIDNKAAAEIIVELFGDPSKPIEQGAQPNRKTLVNIWELFQGAGKGADLPSARGTRWGLLNAVTEHIDHHARARSNENRLNSAWFGQGATVKAKALELLVA